MPDVTQSAADQDQAVAGVAAVKKLLARP
jgi:hypothetical protein